MEQQSQCPDVLFNVFCIVTGVILWLCLSAVADAAVIRPVNTPIVNPTFTATPSVTPTVTPSPTVGRIDIIKDAPQTVEQIEVIRKQNENQGIKIKYSSVDMGGKFIETTKKEPTGMTSWRVESVDTRRSTTVYYLSEDVTATEKYPFCVYINFDILSRRE